MTINQKIKNYFKEHSGATIEDWQNQRHRMHIIQYARTTRCKHPGSKTLKKLLQVW